MKQVKPSQMIPFKNYLAVLVNKEKRTHVDVIVVKSVDSFGMHGETIKNLVETSQIHITHSRTWGGDDRFFDKFYDFYEFDYDEILNITASNIKKVYPEIFV